MKGLYMASRPITALETLSEYELWLAWCDEPRMSLCLHPLETSPLETSEQKECQGNVNIVECKIYLFAQSYYVIIILEEKESHSGLIRALSEDCPPCLVCFTTLL